MQLQFQEKAVSCLSTVCSGVQYQEQTQELRLPEQMPDVGSILGAWGQVLIRGKEWRSGSMSVSGGVMAWAMYRPEDGGEPQMVEAWIPFQMKWELPQTQYDGKIRVYPLLRSMDARTTSARKLMFRTSVGIMAEAVVPAQQQIFEPGELPEGIEVLVNTYPMLLPREAGEKAFDIEEELSLPASAATMDRLLRFSLQPELIDQKVMSGKAVFRGICIVHILYMGDDGQIHTWDFEVPYSQYADLEGEYEEEAGAAIWMALTGLELDADMDGKLHLKAGLTGQYLICDRAMVQVAEDAYGIKQTVIPQKQMLQLPAILDEQKQTVQAQIQLPDIRSGNADVAFYPDQPYQDRKEDKVVWELGGYFQILGYNDEGELCDALLRWNGQLEGVVADNCMLTACLQPTGIPQISGGNGLSADMLMRWQTVSDRGIPIITGLQTEKENEDAERPSLILRRAGEDSLWDIAKATGSTVKGIREANALDLEPDPDRILLIPVR